MRSLGFLAATLLIMAPVSASAKGALVKSFKAASTTTQASSLAQRGYKTSGAYSRTGSFTSSTKAVSSNNYTAAHGAGSFATMGSGGANQPAPSIVNRFKQQTTGLSTAQQQTLRKSQSAFRKQKSHSNTFTLRRLPNNGWSVERRLPSQNAGYSKIYETQIAKDGTKVLSNKSVIGPGGKLGKVSTKEPDKQEVILQKNK